MRVLLTTVAILAVILVAVFVLVAILMPGQPITPPPGVGMA